LRRQQKIGKNRETNLLKPKNIKTPFNTTPKLLSVTQKIIVSTQTEPSAIIISKDISNALKIVITASI
jgi:hypothetical protein